MRLNLGRALISRAQLLLLDEPTNHLDLDAVVWLERWLAGYRGTLLLVSHDRDFLDGCVTQVLSFGREALELYAGNYSAYELQRAERLAVQQAMFERQQRELAHIHRFVERFRAKASKARQVQSRLKALDRMERIAAAHVDTPFDFEFPEPARAPDPLLVIEDGEAGYGERPVLRGLRLSLRPGSRLGLLGPNGAGKSTLVKLLAGEIAPLAGQRVAGYGLAIGYFAQHQLEQLRPADSLLQHLVRVDPQARELDLRKYLGSFDFRGAMADAPVGPLSGGEKSRLALALLVRTRPNLLLLDEPTNHLDLEMRHALTRALAEYDGSLVLVSHDRALLRTICDGFLLVADGVAREFDGDLDDYMDWLEQRRQQRRAVATGAASDADKAQRLEQRSAVAAGRQQRLARRRPLLNEVTRLERDLATWQAERARLDALLGDPDFYVREPPATVERCARDRAALESRIESAESRWLEVQAELEAVGAD
jgi:ATP-binding cassette subfamily F protein 3